MGLVGRNIAYELANILDDLVALCSSSVQLWSLDNLTNVFMTGHKRLCQPYFK